MMNAVKKTLALLLVIVTVAMTMLAACQEPEKTSFTFIAEIDGVKRTETVSTEKGKVGEALVDEGFIVEGTGTNKGMFFSVFGFGSEEELKAMSTDTSGAYWAFYINGEYATAGIFDTEVTDGAIYTVRLEKWDLNTFG